MLIPIPMLSLDRGQYRNIVKVSFQVLSLSNDSYHSSQGQEAGPSAELVSQMMEEALGQNDQTSGDKERSG